MKAGELLAAWDDDDSGAIEADEFGPGLFATWDDKRDGMLQDDEFLL